ncbi:MAG: TlpA family protein disulfide reductase [Chitinophagaceae bacterium]|nr:TlpA family protein disulfide reductase [Chitinophagaceae bacterium]MCB9047010.1 TlpA family protein disulfide reductase [Chitinophagales bacterium]
MKQLLTIAFSLLALSTNAHNTAVLKGMVSNPISDSIHISYITDFFSFQSNKEHIALDKNGAFSVTLSFDDDYLDVDILHGNQSTELVVTNGSEITLTLDAANFDSTIQYTGNGSEIANFCAKHVLEEGPVFSYTSKAAMMFSKEKKDFAEQLDMMAKEKAAYIESESSLTDNFKQYWKNKFVYNNYYLELMYPTVHKQFKPKDGQGTDVDDIILTKIPKETFNDEYISVPEYKIFVYNYIGGEFVKNKTTPETELHTADSIMQVMILKLPHETAEYGLANILCQMSKIYSLTTIEHLYSKYRKHFPNGKYSAPIENAIAIKTNTGKGKPAMNFTATTSDGKTVSLSELKGKVVYIDFWASWCTPCIRELPHSKKVSEHFAGNDKVVFLSISIDQDKNSWKSAIDKYKIPGINAIDGNGWEGTIARLYHVQSVPSYFLVDKNGNFALDRTLRPSDEEALISAIEALVK